MARRHLAILTALLGIGMAHPLRASERETSSVGMGNAFFTIPPCRLVDTRKPIGQNGGPALAGSEKRILTVVGFCGIPANAFAIAANFTVVSPAASGTASLYAGDGTAPPDGTISFSAQQVRANNALVTLASDNSGTIALENFSAGKANFVIDLIGYFACSVTVLPADPTLPNATTGVPYDQSFTASDGSGSYTFAVTSGTPPPGLNLSAGGDLAGTPTASGDFSFTVTATDTNLGCPGTQDYTLHVDCETVVVTAATDVCAASTGNIASATAGMDTYAWLITNGTITSAADSQSITYTAGASGSVGLTVNTTYSNCAGQGTANVTIDPVPSTPTITPSPTQVCADSTGNTADGPLGATGYAWTITNGTITSATNIQTITYTAGTSGSVMLGLTVMNASACAASNSVGVTINANPDPPVIAAANPQAFTVTGGSGTFTLTFNGQTTTPLNFDATAADVQTALTALSSIGGAGGSVVVTQLAGGGFSVAFGGSLTGPQPQLTALGAGGCVVVVSDPAVCSDSTGNQASGPAGATTYAWSITNGTITSANNIQTIVYMAGTSGMVKLDLTVTNAACAASNSLNLNINDSPASPTITPSASEVCANSTGNTADGPAGATTYAWSITNGTITSATNAQSISYTAGASGTTTLHLTVTNDSNCSATNSLDITVDPAPAAPTITPSPAQVCAGSTGNQASGPAGATTYAWSISNGSITAGASSQTVTYTAGSSGQVSLTLVVTNAQGCSSSNNVKIPIKPTPAFTPASGALPTGTYGVAYPLSFAGTGGTGPYNFVLASGALPTGMTLNADGSVSPNTPVATGPFAFSVTVTDASGCSSTQVYSLSVQPSLSPDVYSGVGNTELFITGFAGAPATPAVQNPMGVLSNDSPPGITVTAGTTACVGLGGSLTIDSAGLFRYTPPVNATGLDTCSYTGTSNGIPAIGAIMVNLVDRVWYVNDVTGSDSGTRGRSQEPLSSIDQAVANASPNDYIFVHFTGADYTGSTLNKDGLTLWGQGTTFTLDNLTITSSSNPTLASTLTLAANNLTVSSLDVSTGAITGVTNSGTLTGLTIKNDVHVTTTIGTAVLLANVDSTAGGPPNNGINFFSVSSNGAVNGISLQNVNTGSGSFVVTGDGTNNASGGTIQNTTTSGVALSGVQNVLLTSLKILNTTRSGINGTGVTNFGFVNGTISMTGSQNFDANIAFNTTNFSGPQTKNGNNIQGILIVQGSTLRNGFAAGLDIQADAGTISNATIANNTVSNTGTGTGGISILGGGNASTSFQILNAVIDHNTVDNFSSAGIQVSVANTDATGPGPVAGVPSDGSHVITIQNNTIAPKASGGGAIVTGSFGANGASRAQANFLIFCNGSAVSPCNSDGALNSSGNNTVISVANNGYADMTTTIDSNIVAANHVGGNSNGIAVTNASGPASSASTPHLTLNVTNNTVSGTKGNGLLMVGQKASGFFNLKLSGNSVSAPTNNGSGRQGIRVDAGAGGSVDDAVCLDISGNTSAGSNGAGGIGLRKQGNVATINDFGVQGIGIVIPTNAQVISFVNLQNPAGGGTDIPAGSNFVDCSGAP